MDKAAKLETERMYYQNTYCYNAIARVVNKERDMRGDYYVLDRTVFHPQGGGQPADKGVMRLGEDIISIDHVGEVEGEIRHYGHGAIPTQAEVAMEISAEARQLYARLHSGGHLIAHVIEQLEPQLKAVKGHHFPDGPHVEFIDPNKVVLPADWLTTVNSTLEKAVTAGGNVW